LADLFAEQGWGAVPPATLTAASSDASFRRYFRWEGEGRSFVVMDAPPPQENCKPFVDIAFLLAKSGINVPKIYAEDLERGFLLLNDLGNKTYLDVIDSENADDLFKDALQALLAFQQLPMVAPLPSYDVALLRRELELFPEWYVKRELGIEFDAAQQVLWQQVSDLLIDSALAQPKVLVHRDYMPRNLMLCEPNPGVLDFQDAVLGPITYDVVSLFRDAFLSWEEEQVLDWTVRYWERAKRAGLPVHADFAEFWQAFEWMGLQRHLKVLGIFARINYRDGKPKYLADTPRFLAYVRNVTKRYAALAPLGRLLDDLE
jgi:aminoglycoside/choline kinase family phosphotransferase